MEKESYLVDIRFCSKNYYAVWKTDDNGNDSLFKTNDKIFITQSKNKLPSDTVLQADNPAAYNFDSVREMLFNGLKSIDFEELNRFWNLSQDAADSISYKFIGHKNKYDKIYDDIFHATSAGRIIANNPNEKYIPQFTKNDLHNLAEIIMQAFEMWTEIIGGLTKENAKENLKKIYDYSPKSNKLYYPLNKSKPKQNHFYIMQGTIEPHEKQIKNYLIKNYEDIFCLQGDRWASENKYSYEKIDILKWSFDSLTSEYVLFPKDFSYVIYFSHECTITFVGQIVDEIKIILKPVEHKINKRILC